MAMTLVLADEGGDFVVTATVACELARLGVTDVTVFTGDGTTGVILEGWAFDPSTAGTAAMALRGSASPGRTLHPVSHTAVSAAQPEREQAWKRPSGG
jgi:hypothetical protein